MVGGCLHHLQRVRCDSFHSVSYRKNKRQATCTCYSCKKFWDRAFEELANRPGGYEAQSKASIHKGDRVLVHGDQLGVVRYVGYADDHLVAPELHVGVCLFKNAQSNESGMYHGKRYFHTDEGHAAMVKLSEVNKLDPAPRTRPVNNPMFPSYGEVQKKRKEMKKNREANERKINVSEKRKVKPNCSKSLPHQEASASNDSRPYYDERTITDRGQQQAERHFQQMKKAFGGSEKGERMALTYTKLEKAFEKGKILACIEKQ